MSYFCKHTFNPDLSAWQTASQKGWNRRSPVRLEHGNCANKKWSLLKSPLCMNILMELAIVGGDESSLSAFSNSIRCWVISPRLTKHTRSPECLSNIKLSWTCISSIIRSTYSELVHCLCTPSLPVSASNLLQKRILPELLHSGCSQAKCVG